MFVGSNCDVRDITFPSAELTGPLRALPPERQGPLCAAESSSRGMLHILVEISTLGRWLNFCIRHMAVEPAPVIKTLGRQFLHRMSPAGEGCHTVVGRRMHFLAQKSIPGLRLAVGAAALIGRPPARRAPSINDSRAPFAVRCFDLCYNFVQDRNNEIEAAPHEARERFIPCTKMK